MHNNNCMFEKIQWDFYSLGEYASNSIFIYYNYILLKYQHDKDDKGTTSIE